MLYLICHLKIPNYLLGDAKLQWYIKKRNPQKISGYSPIVHKGVSAPPPPPSAFKAPTP